MSTNGDTPGAPDQVSLEYTRGTGAFFPTFTTQAVKSGSPPPAGIGASFPASPTVGQLFYNTSSGHLFVWSGATWLSA